MPRFPPPPPGAERRVHPRHDVVVSVEVAHDDTIAIASLVNVSQGGAFVQLADADSMAVGVRVRVHLAGHGKDVKGEAKIVRVTAGERAGVALAWIAPSASLRKLIDRLVATAPAERIERSEQLEQLALGELPVDRAPTPVAATAAATVDAGW
jgi:hypothetical protein